MRTDWERPLSRWTSASLLDPETADRIRTWEAARGRGQTLRWPTQVALAFGALLLGAGILLFVSAHWDTLSPSARMALVLLMVAIFHIGGAVATTRFEAAAIALHPAGTVALGAGIALAGQIYHLSEHWPSAILLWAVGAGIAWAILGHWTQAAFTAILAPYWLCSEWIVRMSDTHTNFVAPMYAGICALSLTYLSARRGGSDSALRKTLGWIGGLAVLPAVAFATVDNGRILPFGQSQAAAWSVAILVPLAIAFLLRGRAMLWNGAAVVWVLLLAAVNATDHGGILIYLVCAAGAAGLVAWGIFDSRPERVNLGIAGFAITVLAFYFSNVMDKLGRSASLIILGLLFLGGGWMLERARRRLLAHIRPEAS